ncbi:hypothetical protein [Actinoplanes friuliensis]|uniref:hypothetical protein n=1 Tax=Actinoplanes friuliensis TaxID=196914 RepID=UPI0011DC9672|nr:hypothetical protein [Actinoplanes friuliensis]
MRLWLDDLVELARVLGAQDIETITIDGDIIAEDINDLRDYERTKVDSLLLQCVGGQTVELSRNVAKLVLPDQSIRDLGMAAEVERITRQRRRHIYRLRRAIFAAIPTFLAVLGIVAFMVQKAATTSLPDVIFVCAFSATIASILTWVLWASTAGSVSSAIIYTRTRVEAPTWLERNRDGLTTNVIVSLVFAVVGFIVGRLTDSD